MNIAEKQILEDELLYRNLILGYDNYEYKKPEILIEEKSRITILEKSGPMPGPCNPPAPSGK